MTKVEIQEKIIHSLYNNNFYEENLGNVFYCGVESRFGEENKTASDSGSMTIPIYKTPTGKTALLSSVTFEAVNQVHKNVPYYDTASTLFNYTIVTDKGKTLSGTYINLIECGIGEATEITISGSASVQADGGAGNSDCLARAVAGIKNVTVKYILLD